jgi:RNA polymerase sigma factor (sigma-70 family)
MATGQMNGLMNRLRRAAVRQDSGGLSDGHLVARFVMHRDGDAFAVLVKRHGRMVMGVCRRVLLNPHDAEDAFQATFLVLARKAASVAAPNALGGWLYRVAYRTALEARAKIARRHATEQQVKDMPDPHVEPEDGWRELLSLLDRELDRLPDKYRVPVVLCELEGKSRKEVAGYLHIPEGTLSSRLAHAKKLLARRLSRYGAALSVGSLTAVLSREPASACVPASLLHSTVRAAVLTAGAVSARVVELTGGVIKAMLLSKLRLVWAVALAAVVGVGAVGLTYRQAAAQATPSNALPRAARATADELEELRLEVAALRKGLEVTRERVRSLENEVRTLKLPAWFAQLDSDRDGQVGLYEWKAAGRSIDEFLKMDKNSDGFLTVEEVLAYQAEHGTPGSGNANGPGRGGYGRNGFRGGNRGAFGGRGFGRGGFGGGTQRTETAPTAGASSPKFYTDPLAEAEAALKKLRANPKDKQAADALERALKQLKRRTESPRQGQHPKDY